MDSTWFDANRSVQVTLCRHFGKKNESSNGYGWKDTKLGKYVEICGLRQQKAFYMKHRLIRPALKKTCGINFSLIDHGVSKRNLIRIPKEMFILPKF